MINPADYRGQVRKAIDRFVGKARLGANADRILPWPKNAEIFLSAPAAGGAVTFDDLSSPITATTRISVLANLRNGPRASRIADPENAGQQEGSIWMVGRLVEPLLWPSTALNRTGCDLLLNEKWWCTAEITVEPDSGFELDEVLGQRISAVVLRSPNNYAPHWYSI